MLFHEILDIHTYRKMRSCEGGKGNLWYRSVWWKVHGQGCIKCKDWLVVKRKDECR